MSDVLKAYCSYYVGIKLRNNENGMCPAAYLSVPQNLEFSSKLGLVDAQIYVSHSCSVFHHKEMKQSDLLGKLFLFYIYDRNYQNWQDLATLFKPLTVIIAGNTGT